MDSFYVYIYMYIISKQKSQYLFVVFFYLYEILYVNHEN